jgi:hypothetical protein
MSIRATLAAGIVTCKRGIVSQAHATCKLRAPCSRRNCSLALPRVASSAAASAFSLTGACTNEGEQPPQRTKKCSEKTALSHGEGCGVQIYERGGVQICECVGGKAEYGWLVNCQKSGKGVAMHKASGLDIRSKGLTLAWFCASSVQIEIALRKVVQPVTHAWISSLWDRSESENNNQT